MKKYKQRHGNILGIKQAIAITNTLKFIGVLKTEMTQQTNQLSRVMLRSFRLFPSFPESLKSAHTCRGFVFEKKKKHFERNRCIKVHKITYTYKRKLRFAFCNQQRCFHQKPKALLTLSPLQ